MNWMVRADFPTPALDRSNTINSKYESWCEPPPPTTTSLYCLKNWAYGWGQPVFQHEDIATRHTLELGVAAISTVCIEGGMGKGGKREEDSSKLKLRRSWDISPQDILRQSTKIYKLSVSVPASSDNAAVHRSKFSHFSAPVKIHAALWTRVFGNRILCSFNWLKGDSGVTVTPRTTDSQQDIQWSCPVKDQASKVGISCDLYQLGTTKGKCIE